ncbi:MAG TPA: FxsA family protein [Acidobacteria bacterium]|nr:FxsA family protein [Acidobacteriota bacterium]
MLGWLAALFIVVPLVELYVLLRLGEAVGFLPTIGIVVFTGVLGAWLARHEGLRTARAMREELDAGHIPADRLMDAALIFAAGILLLTPGILTDITGFLLLAPPVRTLIRGRIKEALRRRFTVVPEAPEPARSGPGPDVIDVEWTEADADDGKLPP